MSKIANDGATGLARDVLYLWPSRRGTMVAFFYL